MAELCCRFCEGSLDHVFVDLGASPLANSYLKPEDVLRVEAYHPLCVYICEQCLLVQLPEAEAPEAIFSDYAYFSSVSESWVQHAECYVEMATARFGLGPGSQVIEIASNDGYLLQFFHGKGIPVLGIEPAGNVAQAARAKGIPTLTRFFGAELAAELVAQGQQADLLLGNNVLAHVPHLNDFVSGLTAVLKPTGVLTMEFPHLLRLMDEGQFDTIYHEHYSYFSLGVVAKVFAAHGLKLFDVEELPTHGGSLRVFACHLANDTLAVSANIERVLGDEHTAGLDTVEGHSGFAVQVETIKRDLLRFLLDAQEQGKCVVGYGAPAKGNTLLNYCGIRSDLVTYTVDRAPSKQGSFLPGVRIPIHSPDQIRETRPDFVLILPWNLKAEITRQMADIAAWGGRFVVAVPKLEVLRPEGGA